MDYPITPAVRFLREKKVDFVPHLYDYVENAIDGCEDVGNVLERIVLKNG